jgi:histone arginine demethylase JMJD6
MKEFIEYVFDQKDDFPLYIFDDGFKKNCPKILKLYNVPKYFPDDLFQEVKNRPPYSWILVGPKRSGTQMHQDPLGTSAWNVSIVGYKLWALFPPSLPRHIAKGLHLSSTKTPSKVPKAEPFTFFNSTLSLIQKKFQLSALTFIQKPGELVFIPSKWWHIVLNLTDTIAITHNFTSRCNFDSVWRMTRKQRKKFFIRWQEKLSKSNPDLLERGKKLDLIDNYG